ncbi:Oidioi.mRNA.OKI2018_I69.PAR.g10072.t1.cds [Oikopleura dioica]|uniref:Gypsy retrotransposon integrase-like protein 1 n=1 Tax=Oikopleura dioica TaxID=34765 RepID=A0ABN7RST9_OIKDI|nr:Oidioi.mRNA.OKI2018_I69.PAR.g10072.t1.cds [Oikopleura dioica]
MKPINDVRNSANETNCFKWTKEADLALKEIQRRLSETPVISFPNFDESFHLYTDASLYAAGGVLLQEYGGRVHLVSAISHTFNKAERKWNTSEKEMFSIVWCCERLEKLLKGRFFQIHTDHRSLIFLHKKKFKNSKISRWQSRLEEFDFHIVYIKGSENQFADFMSRRPGEDDKSLGYDSEFPVGREYEIDKNSPVRVFVPFWNENQFPEKITLSEVKIHKVNVKAIAAPMEIPLVSANYNNILDYQREDSALSAIITFLESAHDLSGHLGEPRTLERLEDVWWPSFQDDVSNYVHSCVPCLRRKGSAGTRTKPPLGTLRRGKTAGESIQIDFACMPPAGGFKYYLVVADTFSRYTWCIPTRSDTAICAAKALIYKVFLPMDFLPKHLHSDRGTHFCASVIDEMCKLNQIKHTISTAFHPQSNAFAERANRTIKNSLFCMVNSSSGRKTWADCVPHVMRALNSVKNKSTKISPREVWFGRKSTFTHSTGAEMTAETPQVFGLNVGALAKSAEAIVKTAMEAADRAMEHRLKNEPKPRPIPLALSCTLSEKT